MEDTVTFNVEYDPAYRISPEVRPSLLMFFAGDAVELLHDSLQARFDVPPRVERKRKRKAKQAELQVAA